MALYYFQSNINFRNLFDDDHEERNNINYRVVEFREKILSFWVYLSGQNLRSEFSVILKKFGDFRNDKHKFRACIQNS